MATPQSRMKNPILVIPDALQSMLAFAATTTQGGVPMRTLGLVHLRASQINGCAVCLEMHARDLRKLGETDERLFTVAAWRESAWFTAEERAALALTEAATRLSDKAEAVSDEVWAEAARYYDEAALASLVLNIGMINFWNRINATTRQVVGTMPEHVEAEPA